MKKTAAIVVSTIFAMGVVIATPVMASDALMSGVKGIAKEHAKGMVNEGVQKAGDTANKKIDELAGNVTTSKSDTVDKAMKTKENVEEAKDKATHEMKEMKGDAAKHMKTMEEMKHVGEGALHGTTGE